MIGKYDKNDMKETLARYIVSNKIPFPFKEMQDRMQIKKNLEVFLLNLFGSLGRVRMNISKVEVQVLNNFSVDLVYLHML